MRGVDTNVLVRYIVRDDLAQYDIAASFFEQMRSSGDRVLIDSIVLCELVWVLKSSYDYSRDEIALTLERILGTEQFDVDGVDVARLALSDFKSSRADFADCLIGRRHQAEGASSTVTLDRRLEDLPSFEVLSRPARRSRRP